MQKLLRPILVALFYCFAAAALVATGLRTFHVIEATTASSITAYFGLALFEAGAIVWLLFGLYKAEGLGQRATAIVASALDLALVIAATAQDVALTSTLIVHSKTQLAATGEVVMQIIVAAAALNVVALWVTHVADPHAARAIREQNAADRAERIQSKIEEEADRAVEAATPAIAKQAASQISGAQLQATVAAALHRYGINQLPAPKVVEGNFTPRPVIAFAADVDAIPTNGHGPKAKAPKGPG